MQIRSQKDNAIKISILHQAERVSLPAGLIARALPALVLYGAAAALLYSSLRLAEVPVPPAIYLLAGPLGLIFSLLPMLGRQENRKPLFVPVIIYTGALIVLSAVFFPAFRSGLAVYLNQIADIRTEITGRITAHFTTEAGESGVWLFSAMVSLILAELSLWAVAGRYRVAALILPAAAVAGACFGIVPVNALLALFLAACVICALAGSVLKTDSLDPFRGVLPAVLTLLILLGLGVGVLRLIGTGKSLTESAAWQSAQAAWHDYRYEERENIMPEGDLRNVGSFFPTGKTMLEVEMSDPESSYLCGFVGEVYQNGVFTSHKGEYYTSYSDLFYWLHEDGFYGQSQPALANAIGLGRKDAMPLSEMTVTNVGACSAFRYTTYAMDQSVSQLSDPRMIGDAMIRGEGSREPYTLEYIPQTVYYSYVTQQDVKDRADAGDEDAKQYLKDEESFREMVYTYDLAIPDEIEEMLEEYLGERMVLSTSQAKVLVLDFLAYQVKYRDEVENNDGMDLVTFFLSKRRAGHSVHYAAAATMMLRYYGVPARYVEGYYISPEAAAEAAENGGKIYLTEKDAHAWTEYYLDGVGWIPFETTPGYINSAMYALSPNAVDGDEGATSEDISDEGVENGVSEESEKLEQEEELDNPINDWQSIFKWRKIWWAFLLGALLLILILTVAIRRLRLRRVIKTFADSDLPLALTNAFSYAVAIMSRRVKGLDPSFLRQKEAETAEAFACGDTYGACLTLNERTLYSSAEVTEEDRDQMVEFARSVKREYRKSRNPFQRIYDRLVLCIY